MPEMNADDVVGILNHYPGAQKVSVVVYSLMKTKDQIEQSIWGRFLADRKKREMRKQEASLKIIDKFDKDSFLDKIKDFL